MKHLQLYEGFLADFEQVEQEYQHWELARQKMLTGLDEKIIQFFIKFGELKHFQDDRHRPGNYWVLDLKGQHDLREISYELLDDETIEPRDDIDDEALKIIDMEDFEYGVDDLCAGTGVRVWDAIQTLYPDHLEGSEMGFFIKESKNVHEVLDDIYDYFNHFATPEKITIGNPILKVKFDPAILLYVPESTTDKVFNIFELFKDNHYIWAWMKSGNYYPGLFSEEPAAPTCPSFKRELFELNDAVLEAIRAELTRRQPDFFEGLEMGFYTKNNSEA